MQTERTLRASLHEHYKGELVRITASSDAFEGMPAAADQLVQLPSELLSGICDHLDRKGLLGLIRSCKTLYLRVGDRIYAHLPNSLVNNLHLLPIALHLFRHPSAARHVRQLNPGLSFSSLAEHSLPDETLETWRARDSRAARGWPAGEDLDDILRAKLLQFFDADSEVDRLLPLVRSGRCRDLIVLLAMRDMAKLKDLHMGWGASTKGPTDPVIFTAVRQLFCRDRPAFPHLRLLCLNGRNALIKGLMSAVWRLPSLQELSLDWVDSEDESEDEDEHSPTSGADPHMELGIEAVFKSLPCRRHLDALYLECHQLSSNAVYLLLASCHGIRSISFKTNECGDHDSSPEGYMQGSEWTRAFLSQADSLEELSLHGPYEYRQDDYGYELLQIDLSGLTSLKFLHLDSEFFVSPYILPHAMEEFSRNRLRDMLPPSLEHLRNTCRDDITPHELAFQAFLEDRNTDFPRFATLELDFQNGDLAHTRAALNLIKTARRVGVKPKFGDLAENVLEFATRDDPDPQWWRQEEGIKLSIPFTSWL